MLKESGMDNSPSKKNNALLAEARQERRQRRLLKKKSKMEQHGKGLAKVYRDAVLKRVKK